MASMRDLLGDAAYKALNSQAAAALPGSGMRRAAKRRQPSKRREAGGIAASLAVATPSRSTKPAGGVAAEVTAGPRPRKQVIGRVRALDRATSQLAVDVRMLKRVAMASGRPSAVGNQPWPALAETLVRRAAIVEQVRWLRGSGVAEERIAPSLGRLGAAQNALELLLCLEPGEVLPPYRPAAPTGASRPPQVLPATRFGPDHTDYYQDPMNSK